MGGEGRATCGGRLRGDFVPHSYNDPEHWRKRAEESRARAEQMSDGGDAKQMMLGIAEDYEKLAKRAEERLAKGPPQSN
jgi:hypothetical protein